MVPSNRVGRCLLEFHSRGPEGGKAESSKDVASKKKRVQPKGLVISRFYFSHLFYSSKAVFSKNIAKIFTCARKYRSK